MLPPVFCIKTLAATVCRSAAVVFWLLLSLTLTPACNLFSLVFSGAMLPPVLCQHFCCYDSWIWKPSKSVNLCLQKKWSLTPFCSGATCFVSTLSLAATAVGNSRLRKSVFVVWFGWNLTRAPTNNIVFDVESSKNSNPQQWLLWCSWVRRSLTLGNTSRKKNVFFRALPEWGRGRPLTDFFGPFLPCINP